MNTDYEIKLCHNEIVEILSKYNMHVINSLGILASISFLINQQLKNETGVK